MLAYLVEFLRLHAAHIEWWMDFAAVLAALSLAFKKVRLLLLKIFASVGGFFSAPIKTRQAVEQLVLASAKVDERLVVIETQYAASVVQVDSLKNSLETLKKLVGFNGGGGLADQVGYILGYQASSFWRTSHPGFVCTAQGDNLEVTQGYCGMLGLKSRADLARRNWQGFVDKEEFPAYLAEFIDVAGRLETFRRPLHFYDVNGTALGEWLVVAFPLSAPGATTVRYIGSLFPSCAAAREIAGRGGWPLHPPL